LRRLGVYIFGTVVAVALALSVGVITQNAIEANRLRNPEYVRMLVDKKYFEEVIAPADLPMHPAGHWKPIQKRSDVKGGNTE